MHTSDFEVVDGDGVTIVATRWEPDDGKVRALVHLVHGWAEHRGRYARAAAALVAAGYAVVTDDHRGHGETGVRAGGLGDLGPRGMAGVLDAVHAVTRAAREAVPHVPVFLLGHSWGSFLAQRAMRDWGGELAGVVLTGTTHRDPGAPRRTRSLNDDFEPARTPYDWLSRDDAEVDRYVADPLCGFERMAGQRGGLDLRYLSEGDDGRIPRALPVLVANGSADPVGGEEGGRRLAEHYRSLGLTDVELRVYPGARHELFNETNRDEFVAGLLAWLDARV